MATTTVLSLRLPTERAESLKRCARRLDRSAAELAARLIDEGLRRSEFSLIDFRDTPSGRQAYIQGSRIPVWRAVTLVRDYNGDLAKTAAHLSWPEFKVKAALNYAEAFPQEIEDAIGEARSCDFDKLKRMIPSLELFQVPASAREPQAKQA
jgi:uncharacterized protein (DUF433 family)